MIDDRLKLTISQSLALNTSVKAAYVLGSFVQGNAGTESDFDLAVIVDKQQPESFDIIYEQLNHIRFPKSLDLSVVDRASSPLFLYQIVSKGERLYERNRSDMVEFVAYVLHTYYDTAHLRAMYREYIKQKFSQISYAH